jgi:hypothetical protein
MGKHHRSIDLKAIAWQVREKTQGSAMTAIR